MFKTILATTLIASSTISVQAQTGPGSNNSRYYSDTYAQVCTYNTSQGRLSMRGGPGTNYRKIKEIPNGHTVGLVQGRYGSDGFWWWLALHNGTQGWVRSDYVCGDPEP
jgi:uncharacterized protein YgiM (DUF1202 family)